MMRQWSWHVVAHSIAALRLDSGSPTAAATTSLTDYIISTVRTSLLHSARGFNRELLAHDCLSVLLCCDGDLPHATRSDVAFAFVHPATLIVTLNYCFHLRHIHCRHCRHKEGDGHLRSRDRFARWVSQFDSDGISSFLRRRRICGQVDLGLRLHHRRLVLRFRHGNMNSHCGFYKWNRHCQDR